MNPVQRAAQNPQTPLIPPNFTDPGTTIQGASAGAQGVGNPFSPAGPNNPYGSQGNQMSRMFGRGLFGLAVLLFLAVSSFATTTVTGKIQNLGTGNVTSGAFIRFWLRGCAGNQPRINGTSIIGPTQGGIFYFDITADSSGNISGTLYSTRDVTGLLGGDIECGGSKTSVWYGMQAFLSGKGGPEVPVHALNTATLDITQVTPITTNPVVTAPTGDSTYFRKDAGNSPITGNTQINATFGVTGTATFTGALNASGTNTFDNLNKVIKWSGSATYPFTTTGLQAASNAACNGTVPGKLELPSFAANGLLTATFTVQGPCWVDGAGKNNTVLQAATALNAPVMSVVGTAHVRLTNFGVDGNRSDNGGTNTNTFDCLDIGSATSDALVDSLHVSNCRNNGILVASSDADITIQNSEVDHNGNGTITSTGTSGINVAAGSGTEKRIHLGPHNRIHDNNGGVIVSNSSNSANPVSDVSMLNDVIFSNGNDALLVTASSPGGGQILNFSATENQTFCNGDSTTRFPAACTAGFYQTHTTNSPGGVGIDLIANADQLIIQPVITSNQSHDNTFEGIATSSNILACVNVTTLTTVTQVAAAGCGLAANQPFKTYWKSGEPLAISAVLYRISSCASATVCTLLDNAVNGNNQTAGLSSYMWATVANNSVYNEGNNAGASNVGPGIFCDQMDGNTFSGNTMRVNNFEGLELFGCSFTSLSGNRAYSNDTSNTASRHTGIAIYGSLASQSTNDTADDPLTTACSGSPCQTTGVFIGAAPNGGGISTNTLVQSSSLYGSVAPYTDNGSNSQINTGTNVLIPGAFQITANAANPASGTTAFTNQSGVGATISTGSVTEFRSGGAIASRILADGSYAMGTGAHLLLSGTTPTIAAGGCGGAAASISYNNGAADFGINVGTTPTAGGCTITLPTASAGWNCKATDITTNSTSVFVIKQSGAGSATSVTLINYSDVAVATAPTASDIWQVSCTAH